jgi:hypothetical protein
MANDKAVKDTAPKTARAKTQDCPDDFKAKPDLNGKNDSGPDPEIHAEKLPPE